MTDREELAPRPGSLAPERFRVLSGSVLKLIAVISMLVDHVSRRILVNLPGFTDTLYHTPHGHEVSWVLIGETVGRLAFPIFAFLLVEGFVHTRSRFRYGRNLLLFAILSEVPFDLSRKLTPLDPTYQNVFFTLFVSYLALCAYERLRGQPARQAVAVLTLTLISMGLAGDYGPRGFGLVFALYLLRSNALGYTVMGSCILTSTWRSALAFLPINLYNGQRGFIRGPVAKFAFYAFYPLHLLAIWLVHLHLFGA